MAGGIRVAVTGATGNIGTSVVRALGADDRVGSILGIARRPAEWQAPKFELRAADVAEDELDTLFAGVDVVIHLAWLFQPTHDPVVTWQANVLGSMKVFDAVARNRVPVLVYSSSVGAYSPAAGGARASEDWPTHGWPGAAYTREKSYLERVLDGFEHENPDVRVVRIRSAFVFQKEAASEQRRLFAGPLLPGMLVRPRLVPVVPDVDGLAVQAVHASDVADAFRLAALSPDARGAYNIAAEPVVDAALLADLLEARAVRVPAGPLRVLVGAAWRAHLVPASPGLFDAVLRLPLMDTTRARTELGWTPQYTATEAIEEFLDGLREGAGLPTPPLEPSVPGGRLRELFTGIGQRP
jgi:nucleoside-diphosphate-sugar epimerase